jgi:hypothetical protein
LQENIILARYEVEDQEKQEMWVRVVAMAAAVWCASGAAMAAGYSEVWNPPESAGHTAKHVRKTTGAAKVKSGAGAKADSKHAARGQHGAQRVVLASKSGSRPAAHGGVKVVAKNTGHGSVKKVTAKNAGHAGVVKVAGTPKSKSKATSVAQGQKPRAPLAQAKPGQGRVMHANLVQGHTAHAHVVKVAAKTGAVKPAAAHPNAPANTANVTASPASVTANSTKANPATASSGSLPPILH